MSQQNVELVRGAFERFLAGASDFEVELLDPRFEWDAGRSTGIEVSVGNYAHLYAFTAD